MDSKTNSLTTVQKDNLIVHNTMPRSSKSGKGGIGHLTRSDGKTYCLDTGNTNAIEINTATYRHTFEGFNGYKEKSPTVKGSGGSGNDIIVNNIRRLTTTECERLQTLDDDYTEFGIDIKGNTIKISDTQRYKMIGNGWTIDVICHFFEYLKNELQKI